MSPRKTFPRFAVLALSILSVISHAGAQAPLSRNSAPLHSLESIAAQIRNSHPQLGSKLTPLVTAARPAKAKLYNIQTNDYPGAAISVANDYNDATTVGQFAFNMDALSAPPSFTLHAGTYRSPITPGVLSASYQGINASGIIVGEFEDDSLQDHGLILNGSTVTPFDIPDCTVLSIFAINDSNKLVGSCDGSGVVAFVGDANGTTLLQFPNAFETEGLGINNNGDVVGYYIDNNGHQHGYLFTGGAGFAAVDFPGASVTMASGINDSGEIAGNYADATGAHGFLYSRGQFQTVDVTGATSTSLFRIKNNGIIVGTYTDSNQGLHGFIGR